MPFLLVHGEVIRAAERTYGTLDLDGDFAAFGELLSGVRQADLGALSQRSAGEEGERQEGLHCTGKLYRKRMNKKVNGLAVTSDCE